MNSIFKMTNPLKRITTLKYFNYNYNYMVPSKNITKRNNIKLDTISITNVASKKMIDILEKTNDYSFIFSAKSGGCNGFNYILNTIDKNEFDEIMNEKPIPTLINKEKMKLIIESHSEFLLFGTTIDFVAEDYSKGLFESKFIFIPDKDWATTCGCGVSFNPKS